MASHLETEKFRSIIIKIGGLAENQVAEAVKAVLSEPVLESKEVKKTENKIDKLDVKIDDICQSVLLCNNLLLLIYDLSSLQCKLVGDRKSW
jgi:phosphate transport system protein